jgi:hypothetical protein
MLMTPAIPAANDQVGLAIVWDGPKPSCNGAFQPPPRDTVLDVCWIGLAGTRPLISHATVTWNRAVPFKVATSTDRESWLTVTAATDRACVRSSDTSCGPQLTFAADPSLPPGDYRGTVTVTAEDPTLLPASLSFVFRITPSPISIEAPPYLWFSLNDSIHSRGPAHIPVDSPAAGTPFSVKIREVQDSGWLSVTPMQGVTPAVLDVFVNPAPSQFAGIGYIDISGPSNTVTEPVNMIAPNPPEPLAYVLKPTPASLCFWAREGGAAAAQLASVGTFLDKITVETLSPSLPAGREIRTARRHQCAENRYIDMALVWRLKPVGVHHPALGWVRRQTGVVVGFLDQILGRSELRERILRRHPNGERTRTA